MVRSDILRATSRLEAHDGESRSSSSLIPSRETALRGALGLGAVATTAALAAGVYTALGGSVWGVDAHSPSSPSEESEHAVHKARVEGIHKEPAAHADDEPVSNDEEKILKPKPAQKADAPAILPELSTYRNILPKNQFRMTFLLANDEKDMLRALLTNTRDGEARKAHKVLVRHAQNPFAFTLKVELMSPRVILKAERGKIVILPGNDTCTIRDSEEATKWIKGQVVTRINGNTQPPREILPVNAAMAVEFSRVKTGSTNKLVTTALSNEEGVWLDGNRPTCKRKFGENGTITCASYGQDGEVTMEQDINLVDIREPPRFGCAQRNEPRLARSARPVAMYTD